jgi:folate-binding protein YgfZ
MISKLINRALLKVSGPDAEGFLQSQFSNDIKHIPEKEIQINAYCQHQGKIIAIIWVFKKNSNFYLSFPGGLKEIVLTKLNMFKLMSQLDIEDYSSIINQYGVIGENRNNAIKINDNLSLLTTRDNLSDSDNNSEWELACIKDKLPDVYKSFSEKFIPQALNLDIDLPGVSFTKGCYPGQEVVARMHYLGKPKRRIFRFTSKFEVSIGDFLNVNNTSSLKSSGQVIRVAKKDSEFQFIGVFEVSHIRGHIFLNDDPTKSVNIIDE